MRSGVVGVLVVAALAAGCEEKKTGGSSTAPSAGASASPDASVSAKASVAVLPGCHAPSAGGTPTKVATGALSLAVAKGKALLVSTVYDGPSGASTTAAGRGRAERVLLGSTGVPEGTPASVNDALPAGDDVSTFAAAVALGGEVTTLAYGLRRPKPSECADGTLVVTGVTPGTRRELVTHQCRPTSTFRGAGRGNLGIAFSDGPAPNTLDAWVIDATNAHLVPLERLVPSPAGKAPATDAGSSRAPAGVDTIDAPSVAAGTTSVAAAYVVVRGPTRELHVARLAQRTGEASSAKVEVLDKENVGTVTTAFDEDTLHVVWSSFVPEKNRYVLRWSKWPAGGAPSAPQSIGTGVLSAIMPSIAIDHGRFLLAWAEGDAKGTTAVKVGASKNGVAFISALATVVSTPGTNAKDPVVALDTDALFVAWKELGVATEVHASSIKCQE